VNPSARLAGASVKFPGRLDEASVNVPTRLLISVGLSVPLEARVGFSACPARAGENCPAAVSVTSPVSVDFLMAIVQCSSAILCACTGTGDRSEYTVESY